MEYLALPDGPGQFIRNSSCSALLRIPLDHHNLARTGLSPAAAPLSNGFRFVCDRHGVVLQPRRCLNIDGLGCSAFARHYLRNHFCFLFLQVLRCFSSLRSPTDLQCTGSSTRWVAPFGNPRINGHLHLPAAYRSLSRPSSPSRAKASTRCPFAFSLFSSSHNAAPRATESSVENKGLEPLTPCLQSRCSEPTELIPLAPLLRSPWQS